MGPVAKWPNVLLVSMKAVFGVANWSIGRYICVFNSDCEEMQEEDILF